MSESSQKVTLADIKTKLGFSEYSARVPALKAAAKCLNFGLSACQLSGDFQVNFPENLGGNQRLAIRRFNEQKGLRLYFHSPTDIPLASRHKHLRLGGVERLFEFMDLAADLGARAFIFHPGRFAFYKISTGKIVITDREIPEIYFERFYDSVRRLADYNRGRLDLLLENTYSFSEKLIEVVDRYLELPSTGLVWDIGHMQHSMIISQNRKTETRAIADFFSGRLKRIKLAHIHDVTARQGHLALGTGNIDLAPYIDILTSLGIDMIIEVFTEKDLKASIEFIETLTLKR